MGAVSAILFALLLFLPLILIVWGIVSAIRNRHRWIESTYWIPGAEQDSLAQLGAKLTPKMLQWRYRITSQGENAFVFTKEYRPPWLAIPIILFFPLGLLSLLYKRTVNVSFAVFPERGGTQVTYSGNCPARLRQEIDASFAGQQSSAEQF